MDNPEYFNLRKNPEKSAYHANFVVNRSSGGGYYGYNLDEFVSAILRVASEGGGAIQLRSIQDRWDVNDGLVALSVDDVELLAFMLNQDGPRFSIGKVKTYPHST